jgi:hypothetical protein
MTSKWIVIVCCATLLLTLSLPAFPQQPQPPVQPPGPPTNEPLPDKSFEGNLVKVDVAAKLLTVKGLDDKDVMFVYNNDTQMTGIDSSPQGLAGKTGTRLKITYRESRGINLAVKIETMTVAREF